MKNKINVYNHGVKPVIVGRLKGKIIVLHPGKSMNILKPIADNLLKNYAFLSINILRKPIEEKPKKGK